MKKKEGITLVAFIITIIVLSILSGITIGTLKNTNLIENAKKAKEKYQVARQDESNKLNEYESKISIDESNRENKPTYKILWSGVANNTGSKASNGDSYSFGTDDISNYDFISLEYIQSDNLFITGNFLNTNRITKDKLYDVACWGYSNRYTSMHFIDNGFIIDQIAGDGCSNYITAIYGLKF